jgi:hypothetical protein
MRWEVTTDKGIHVVSAFNSSDAVAKVKQTDSSKIRGAKILPKNTIDNVKSLWQKLIS